MSQSTNNSSNITISSTVNAQVQRVNELMKDQGLSMEEALAYVLTETAAFTGARRDNIAYIKSQRNLPEVRRCKKIAFAKISKSKGKEASIARYKEEIKAAEDVINALIAEINAAEVPWIKAMELGETTAGAFNYFLETFKEDIDQKTDEKAKELKMSKADLKSMINKITPTVGDYVPATLKEAAQERITNQDMMVITIIRKANFLGSFQQ